MGKSKTGQVVSSWRLIAMAVCCLVVALILVCRFVALQILPGEKLGQNVLQNRANRQMIRNVKLPASRGVISDRNGEPLAVSTPVVSIFANPRELMLVREQWGKLASLLKLDAKYLADRIEKTFKEKISVFKAMHVARCSTKDFGSWYCRNIRTK